MSLRNKNSLFSQAGLRHKVALVILFVVTVTGTVSALQYINNQTAKADFINSTDFVTTWRISDPGSTSITIQTSCCGYNYNVDWNNDGVVDETGLTGNVTHDFGSVGDYTIRISGTFPRIYNYFNASNSMKLIDINQWGTNQWDSMSYAFSNTGLTTISATDAPDLSNVTYMANMFSYTPSFNSDLSHWDTSHATNMSNMFYQAAAFNGDISSWDTSNVTTMYNMLYQAGVFNQDISGWNTSNVTDMAYMFGQASAFNQDLTGWNTSKVTSMSGMFDRATAFNGNISSWNTSSVTNMSNMFGGASAFNQDISGWTTSNVVNMYNMFSGATAFNQSLSGWNTAKVTNMSYMFNGASAFNQDISSWNTAAVTNMRYMFSWATSFNRNLTTWNTSNVTNMSWMFQKASAFNGNIATWNTAKVTDMWGMFSEATVFNQNIAGWDTSKVTDMSSMFNEAHAFNQNLATWNVTSVTDMYNIFYGTYQNTPGPLSSANYDATLVGWAAQIGLKNNVSLGSGLPAYCSPEGKAARQSLTTNHNWSFSGNDECSLPFAPTNLLATPAAYSSSLSWTTPGNTGRSLTDYQIEYSSDNGETWNSYPHTPSTATSIVLEELSANTDYRFRVAGVNAKGVGTASSTATTTTLTALPDAPQNLKIIPSAYSATLSWGAPLRDGGLAITDYSLEYSIDEGDSWQAIPRDASAATSYEVTDLTPATDYSFRTAAVNSLGTGEFSIAVTTRTLSTTPDMPTDLEADPGVESVSLSWQAPAFNGGEEIMDYLVEYSSDGGETWREFEHEPAASTSVVVNGLTPNTGYSFKIAAINSVGTGTKSQAVEVTTLSTIPGAPTNLVASASKESVHLQWIAPADDGGEAITNYLVEYSLDDGLHWINFEHAPSAATSVTVDKLYINTLYKFKVSAINSNGTSSPSNIAQATPVVTPTTVGVNGAATIDDPGTPPMLPKRPTFSGTTIPLSEITVTVHSDPVTCSTTATSEGDWSCTLPSDLEPGAHEVFVTITLPDNTTHQLGPYAIEVEKNTPAVVTPESPQVADKDSIPDTKPTYYFNNTELTPDNKSQEDEYVTSTDPKTEEPYTNTPEEHSSSDNRDEGSNLLVKGLAATGIITIGSFLVIFLRKRIAH